MKIKLFILLLSSFFVSSIAAEELKNLLAKDLVAMQKEQNALIIDIRTEKEWNSTGIIPGSHKLQFFSSQGKYDIDKWMTELNKLKKAKDQPVVLVCRSGNRSGMVGKMLMEQLQSKNVYHLSSGISSWVLSGNKVSKD